MRVRDIVASALKLIGRAELDHDLLCPSQSTEEDAEEVVDTLMYCFNAVEDELARKYIPLVASEEMSSDNNRFLYSAFKHCPIKIRRVTVNNKPVTFDMFTKYMSVQAKKIVVEYEYAPKRKTIEDDSEYDDGVGEYLIALGIASEYSIINGEAEMADRWENKYRAQLDKVQRALPVCANIPPRRWV